MRNLELPGRSPVHSTQGMAATSHTLSTGVALDILKDGGNALDAAIAACAVQCVVEPGSTGIGGDNFCLYSKQGTDDIIGFNGSGRAPAAASLDKLRSLGVEKLTRTSPHSVIVPGAVDAWCRLNADHGSMPLAKLLEPAIELARKGYPVSSRVHVDWTMNAGILAANENAARIFLPVPEVGALHRQPELADALELIGREGRRAFYEGDMAVDMVSTLKELGGVHELSDFKSAAGEYVTPISTTFRGKTVHECPPNGQGVTALLLLNMFENGPTDVPLLSKERIHFELEACRRAYANRDIYLADPASSEVPVDEITDKAFSKSLCADIDPEKAVPPSDIIHLPKHRDTVYISVVDKDRNCCSFINTLFWGWGSGITTPKFGIVMTNRGEGFVMEEGHPNCIAPGKRPLHTIIPGMVTDNGRVELCFGVMGGEYQAMGHAQFLSRYYDFGLDIQQAQDEARFMVDPFTQKAEIESPVDRETFDLLKAKGHDIARSKRPIGGSQVIAINWQTGVLTGGSDPRKDGCALGY